MDLQSYWLFVCASVLLCVVPGPDMVYLLTRSVARGRKAGLVTALGINLGGYFHLLAAITGIGAVVATSSLAFSVLKWCGAIYLIYLGISALRSRDAIQVNGTSRENSSLREEFWQGFLVDALNPKVAIFFMALLPQFVQPMGGSIAVQLAVLGLTVNIVALAINIILVFVSQALTRKLRQNPNISLALNKVMGVVFIGLGVRLAGERVT